MNWQIYLRKNISKKHLNSLIFYLKWIIVCVKISLNMHPTNVIIYKERVFEWNKLVIYDKQQPSWSLDKDLGSQHYFVAYLLSQTNVLAAELTQINAAVRLNHRLWSHSGASCSNQFHRKETTHRLPLTFIYKKHKLNVSWHLPNRCCTVVYVLVYLLLPH